MISPAERPHSAAEGIPSEDAAVKPAADPRAARTRQLIFQAVTDLMSEQPASLSVTDIVRTAGISRSSFYAHFTGLDELATDFLRAQLADIASSSASLRGEPLSGPTAARIAYSELIEHMVENYRLYSNVLELPLSRGAHDRIVAVVATRLQESVFNLSSVPSGVTPKLVATYVAGGAITLMSSWIRGDTDVSDDELIEQLVGLLPSWLQDSPTGALTP